MVINNTKLLKELILARETLIVPDAYDALSARLIELAGFKAVQYSGLSHSISCCYDKEALLSKEENLAATTQIVESVSVPVMADGEDGFGEPEVVYNTIKEYINAGVSGINIEDQILKGEQEGRVVEIDVMSDKIIAAKKAATDTGNNDFVLNARTDVISTLQNRKEGMRQAIDRANVFLENGADMAFVTYIQNKDELRLLAKEINGPISISAGIPYTLIDFSIDDCKELGISRVSLPTALVFAAIQGMKNVLDGIQKDTNLMQLHEFGHFCSKDTLHKVLDS